MKRYRYVTEGQNHRYNFLEDVVDKPSRRQEVIFARIVDLFPRAFIDKVLQIDDLIPSDAGYLICV